MESRYPSRDRRPNTRFLQTPETGSSALQEEIRTVEKQINLIERKICATEDVVRQRQNIKPNLSGLKKTLFATKPPSPVNAVQFTPPSVPAHPIAVVSQPRASSSAPANSRTVNLTHLRHNPSLVEDCNQKFQALLNEEDPDESDVITPTYKGKKLVLKSGMDLKASEGVQYQLIWPHCVLQYQYVTQSMTYKDLNLSLLVAGELEIITSLKQGKEQEGRLNLLKALAYESNVYPYRAISEWYAAFLMAIEKGRNDWDASPYLVGHAILAKYKPKSADRDFQANLARKPNVHERTNTSFYFCAQYNRGKCSKPSPHENKLKGKLVQVHHVCAACLLKNNVRNTHAESSNNCPLFAEAD